MDHKTILVDLGDNQTLATLLGVHQSTVSRWKSEGIPAEHWPRLLRIAHARRIWLTLDMLEAGSPTYTDRYKGRPITPVS
ncbi:MAG TPA: hypothetical protein VEU08_18815 [Vicinamibacterales bacterium]|nr:hypothetical protein [Vicinamibacterales bacterium]